MDVGERYPSYTYQLKPPIYNDALYFTIVEEGGVINGIFLNSKQMESFQWITALVTSYMDQLKSGTSVKHIINSMKDTFDPKGSYIVPGGIFAGQEVNSVVHHLGLILEEHMSD